MVDLNDLQEGQRFEVVSLKVWGRNYEGTEEIRIPAYRGAVLVFEGRAPGDYLRFAFEKYLLWDQIDLRPGIVKEKIRSLDGE